ncbi:hypothetical protein WJX73_010206 [Symbiochloris irregularis]|uniref:Uncharacterized protein n=1 Tax=Symbiochloris irregularis TaxID=706552 RepID=A0AAW1NQ39_9CHLO
MSARRLGLLVGRWARRPVSVAEPWACSSDLPASHQHLRHLASAQPQHQGLRPPPSKIILHYHEDEVDNYIALADMIEEAFPDLAVDGEEDAAVKGSIKVTKEDGEQIHMLSHEDAGNEGLVNDVLLKAGFQKD